MPGLVDKNKTYLIGLECVELDKLPTDFLGYDTTYPIDGREEQYPLPKRGSYMILFLYTESNQVWTTIRRFTQSKHDYYRSIVGQEVKIVIEED
jgi:hypothetical protein